MKIQSLLILALAQTFALAQPAAEATALKSTIPAERLKEGWWQKRWDAKLTQTKEAEKAELVFLGDSITQGWEGGAAKTIWEEKFAKYGALNLGFSGDRTEHLLWRLKNDEENLKKLSPKVAVILIGTNNTGHEQRPAADTTAGIKAVLDELQAIWPKTKLLVLSVFPRGEGPEDKMRKLNDEINVEVAKLADNKKIFVLDISSSFMAPDGTLPKEIMPDKLHLSGQGYELWAKALEPKLKELGL
jgi:lysophospholipase L1-like esterase